MSNKKCDCCEKNNLKTGNLKSELVNKNFTYCLICGAINAEPKHIIDEIQLKLKKTKLIIEDGVPLIYYDNESDSYIDIRTGPVPFHFKDRTTLKTREEVVKRFKKKGNLNDIFILED